MVTEKKERCCPLETQLKVNMSSRLDHQSLQGATDVLFQSVTCSRICMFLSETEKICSGDWTTPAYYDKSILDTTDLLGQHLAIPSEWAGWEKAVLFSFTMCFFFAYRHLSISLTNYSIAAKLCTHHGPFETSFLCLVWGLGCLYLRFSMI